MIRKKPKGSLGPLHAQIADYADADKEYGWITVEIDGKSFRFPHRAVIWYTFGRTKGAHFVLPEYQPFSPSGIKMQLDDRYHTDCWIGARLPMSEAYNRDFIGHRALEAALDRVITEWEPKIKCDFTVLADGRQDKKDTVFVGMYDYDPLEPGVYNNSNIACADRPSKYLDSQRGIAVPYAGVQYDLAAKNADVILTEVGGALAHLAILSRERGKLLLRVNDAVARFPWPTKLMIDLKELTIKPIRN